MIGTLDELKRYSRRMAAASPSLKDEVLLEEPGCSEADAERLLAALPGLPESYLRVIRSVDLTGKSIGYFRLSPGGTGKASIHERLVHENHGVTNPHARRLLADGTYQVAWWESELIAVAHRDGPYQVGNVVIYSHEVRNTEGRLLADDFLQFLLLAATLDEVRLHSDEGELDDAQATFDAALAALVRRSPEEIARTWRVIATEVLG